MKPQPNSAHSASDARDLRRIASDLGVVARGLADRLDGYVLIAVVGIVNAIASRMERVS